MLLFVNILFAQDIDSLLQELESNSEKSLHTVDEKLGHVTIYSQKDLRLMQYTTVSDLLKELPYSNLNKNRFGTSSLSLSGSKADVGGFFRIFINNHEVSSNYTQSIPESWMELPMEMVDYIEVYRGDSSFSLGGDNGIFFIRIYTKKPSKDNSTKFIARVHDNGSNSQSVTQSSTFENGWSYLAYFSNNITQDDVLYKDNTIHNDSDKKYFYLNVQKGDTDINIGYVNTEKDNYFGFSLDADSDSGEIASQDYFADITTYFLDDKSIKVNLSFDINQMNYEEQNQEGLALLPVLDFANLGQTIPKYYSHDAKVIQTSAFVSKGVKYADNNLVFGLKYQNKKRITEENRVVNFLDATTEIGAFNDFNQEQIYSLFFQDDYRLNRDFLFVLNGKIDHRKRDGTLEDSTDEQYKVGMIYTPHESFGIKTFYTKTYITPSFYNIDYAESHSFEMKNQKYKIYEIEAVYANKKSRLSFLYTDVSIKDFIYFTPVGFINVDHKVKSQGVIIDYSYEVSPNNIIELNYFQAKLSENISNSNESGYVKFMGEYDSFEYFTSLIYRNAYRYYSVSAGDSYDFNFGATYNYSKNLSLSLKAENLFNDATKSLYKEGLIGSDFALKDYQKDITFSFKWVF